MTAPAHETDPTVTDGSDVHVRVRAGKTASVTPIRPGLGDPSGRAHAISRSPAEINTDEPSKVRNFASPHVAEARTAAETQWPANVTPRPFGEVLHEVTHPHGVADILAGPYKLLAYLIAYTLTATADTNKRVAVAVSLLTLSTLIAWAISAYAA